MRGACGTQACPPWRQAGSGRPAPVQGGGGCLREGPGGQRGQEGPAQALPSEAGQPGQPAVPRGVARAGTPPEGTGPVPPARAWDPLLIPAHYPQTRTGGAQREPQARPGAGCLPPRPARGCSLALFNLRSLGWQAVARSLQTSLPALLLAAKSRRQPGSKAAYKLPGLAQGSVRPPPEPARGGCPRAPRIPQPGHRAPACSPQRPLRPPRPLGPRGNPEPRRTQAPWEPPQDFGDS